MLWMNVFIRFKTCQIIDNYTLRNQQSWFFIRSEIWQLYAPKIDNFLFFSEKYVQRSQLAETFTRNAIAETFTRQKRYSIGLPKNTQKNKTKINKSDWSDDLSLTGKEKAVLAYLETFPDCLFLCQPVSTEPIVFF